jgi:hypothetical protein
MSLPLSCLAQSRDTVVSEETKYLCFVSKLRHPFETI